MTTPLPSSQVSYLPDYFPAPSQLRANYLELRDAHVDLKSKFYGLREVRNKLRATETLLRRQITALRAVITDKCRIIRDLRRDYRQLQQEFLELRGQLRASEAERVVLEGEIVEAEDVADGFEDDLASYRMHELMEDDLIRMDEAARAADSAFGSSLP